MKQSVCILILLTAAAAHAGPRSSASYSITTDTTETGGARTTSAAYTNDGSAGGVAGLSTATSPAQTAKSGYVGQLYDITGLSLTATASTVNEGATVQLAAWQALDDASFLAVPATSVTWSVQNGPIASVNAGGLATADVVYQDTASIAQGDFGSFTGLFNLTVLDSIPDNFGSYAADGLGDDWQVQYFGLENPNAGPDVRTDGTGLTNLFKYTAGLIPNDATSRFTVDVQPVNGQPSHKSISFSPAFADRNYTILFSTSLEQWNALTGAVPGNGGTTTLTDTDAGGTSKFYRIEVNKP